MLSLFAFLLFQATAVPVQGIQVQWPAVPNATSYDVWRRASDNPTFSLHIPTKNTSITDLNTKPGITYTYSVATVRNQVFNEVIYTATITIPPQPDIHVILKKGGKITSVPITRRKGDTSTTAPITINKSTQILVETK